MSIRHLVLSGGGPSLISSFGIMKTLHKKKYLDINDIESIYATSGGAIIASLFALKIDMDVAEDYIIKRPWQKAFHNYTNDILSIITNKGINGIELLKIIFEPLLLSKDINTSPTLKEFYDITNVDLHFMSVDINSSDKLKLVDINYKTHDDMLLFHAIAASSAVPCFIQPVFHKDSCYIDGGIICNYPINICLESGINEDNLLAIKSVSNEIKHKTINNDSSFIDFFKILLNKSYRTIETTSIQKNVKNQIICDNKDLTIDIWLDTYKNIELRKKLLQKGIEDAELFMKNKENSKELDSNV